MAGNIKDSSAKNKLPCKYIWIIIIPKGLERELKELEIRGWIKTIQTTALLRVTRILKRILETSGDLLSLRFQWKIICWCEKLARRPDWVIINKKKRTCHIVDFAVPADDRVKIKESKRRDKYLDLARKLRKLWKTKVTVMPIVISTHGTVPKPWKSNWKSRKFEHKTRPSKQHCWDQTEYWEESWRPEETCCHSDSHEGPSANAGVKNLSGISKSKVSDHSRGWPEGSLFDSYYTKV